MLPSCIFPSVHGIAQSMHKCLFPTSSKDRTKYDAQVIGKNPIGHWMSVLSERAGLSRDYSNHEICKTCATGMMKGGVPVPDIAHHLKHKDIQTLKHYLEKPDMEEKRRNAAVLHNYTISDPSKIVPIPRNDQQPQQLALPSTSNVEMAVPEKENRNPQNAIIPFEANLHNQQPPPIQGQIVPTENPTMGNIQNNSQVVTNQLRQAPMLFSGATFNNCTINLQVPQ